MIKLCELGGFTVLPGRTVNVDWRLHNNGEGNDKEEEGEEHRSFNGRFLWQCPTLAWAIGLLNELWSINWIWQGWGWGERDEEWQTSVNHSDKGLPEPPSVPFFLALLWCFGLVDHLGYRHGREMLPLPSAEYKHVRRTWFSAIWDQSTIKQKAERHVHNWHEIGKI